MTSKKQKKLRVALRKNRQKKTRERNLTRDVLDSGIDDADVASAERLSGKGALTRYRTVVGIETDDGAIVRDVEEADCLNGRVLSAVGLNCLVHADDGRRFECSVRRILRTLDRDERNVVATGDRVLFRETGGNQGVIERVEPRTGTISRGSGRHAHVIVANVDQILITGAAADPHLKTNLIDRMLISAEKGGVPAIVCINKMDLADPAELQPVVGMYATLGYEVLLTSAETGAGISRLKQLLAGRQTVIAGQSGVGKSSLLNAAQPDFDLQTGEISGWTGKGRHTTRRAISLPLDCGGWVIDTPGIRQMQLWDVIPEEVEAFYREFRPFVPRCKFPDCSHTHESGCGVKAAVDHGLISERRFESYLRVLDDN